MIQPQPQEHAKRTYIRGLRAEAQAAQYLHTLGYVVLATRVRTPHGEVDIVAADGSTLVAVEVKYRRTLDHAAHAITPRQQQRLCAALEHLAAEYSAYNDIRLDALLLDATGALEHIINALG